MKHSLLSTIKIMVAASLGVLTLVLAPQTYAESQPQSQIPYYTGVGPATAGSFDVNNLPSKAIHFLEHHFGTANVSQCVKDYDDNAYEVDLADGTDIEFDSKGEWTEVDAPEGKSLPSEVVTKLLPKRAYAELKERGLTESVETVKHGRGGYIVELADNTNVDDMAFNNAGHFTGMLR